MTWCLEISTTKWCLKSSVYFDHFSTSVPQPFHGVQIALPELWGWNMDCFCSLVAVVILSLPWNSISRETETFAAVSTFLVLYLVEVFTELVASLTVVSLCQGKQIHGNRASYSGHIVFQNKQLCYPFPKLYEHFEVSPSLAEAMELLLVMMMLWTRALGEWLMTLIELPGGEERGWWERRSFNGACMCPVKRG